MGRSRTVAGLLAGSLVGVALHDLFQRQHAVIRNFPVVGHLRYALESIGPELRQYVVTDNDEERPFNRDQRRWVYATAKGQNNLFGFGTDSDIDRPGHVLVASSAFPIDVDTTDVPMRKTLGGRRARRGAFVPSSIVNLSAMSFGSLSGPAIQALNEGAASAGCLHNTGEGAVSPYHRRGAELIWQIGTGYFGARTPDGRFDLERVVATVERDPVRAIEIKLSQGAKPGLGGVLPGAKVTAEIAEIRGVPEGETVHSPGRHPEFDDIPGLVDFVEGIADATGLPVGIKSAVGDRAFWSELAGHMASTGRGPDFVTVDGGEGGTGAAPLAYTDHVALPFMQAFPVVRGAFDAHGLGDEIVFFGSGKLGFPVTALLAMAMGCDGVNVAREAMLSVGCIQAQRCHTGRCPTGVATQNRWLTGGLDPASKAVRAASYLRGLRHEIARLAGTTGHEHPADVTLDAFDVVVDRYSSMTATEVLAPRRR